jgi:hypothetical protein
MRQFNVGDRVVFRESETGAPETGMVVEVYPPDTTHPNGGLYRLELDVAVDGSNSVEAWWAELTPEP